LNSHWLDKKEFPFRSNFINLDMGRMHYVDEGDGEPIVMCHGNPTWSFLYRHLVKGLSPHYRCVAIDYIGFGLSDKPLTWSYLPHEQARNVETLIDRLGLKDITLVVQDWGGPIGLSYALRHPDNVKRLVIMNTWLWSVKGV
jgi:haloalkane dehalogenase